MEKHHIIYRSQGGLDFPLNLVELEPDEHRGNNGPHRNRKKDLELKRALQANLNKILCKDYYTIDELVNILQISRGQAEKAVRRLMLHSNGYDRNDILRRLMGGRLY